MPTNLYGDNDNFDLLVSMNTLHNLYNYELDKSKKDALEITISPKQLTDSKYQIFAKYFDYLKISIRVLILLSAS